MADGREVELKLRLAPHAAAALLAHPVLRERKAGRLRREELAAAYFDTADLALARHGVALRLRRERGRWIQALKGRGSDDGALAQRQEHEWDLGRAARRPAPDLARAAEVDLGRTLAAIAGDAALVVQFSARIERITLPLAFDDGSRALLALDRGTLHTPGPPRRSERVCEIEIELVAGAAARLYDVARALAADLPLSCEVRSKAQRGFALVDREPPCPVRATPVTFAADAAAPVAHAAIVRNALAQAEANVDGVLAHDDPEWIHQLRVGIRRLRSALGLARPPALPAPPEALVAALRDFAHALGPARDLDVFVDATLPALREAARGHGDAAAEAALDALAASAAGALAEARGQARQRVGTRDFQVLLLDVGAYAAGVVATAAPPCPGPAFAADVLRRRHRRVLRDGAAVTGDGAEARHAARIAVKKLRYATEFFLPHFGERRGRDYRKALAVLQEALGAANDASVAVALAAQVAPGSTGAALVAGWALGRTGAQRRALDRAWQAFAAARPYWKD